MKFSAVVEFEIDEQDREMGMSTSLPELKRQLIGEVVKVKSGALENAVMMVIKSVRKL